MSTPGSKGSAPSAERSNNVCSSSSCGAISPADRSPAWCGKGTGLSAGDLAEQRNQRVDRGQHPVGDALAVGKLDGLVFPAAGGDYVVE
jgi:hypothetical protein